MKRRVVAYGRHQAGLADNFIRQTLPFHIAAISAGDFGEKTAGGQMRDLAMLSTSGKVYLYESGGKAG